MEDCVFVLQHTHVLNDETEIYKDLGVYSSQSAAEEALARFSSKPGFRDALDGFNIDRFTLDRDSWAEGYETVFYEDGT